MKLILKSSFERDLENAETYEQWSDAAIRYDQKYRLDYWKKADHTRRYDYINIRQRLDSLRAMRADQDDHGLLFALNEGIHGNMGGMGRDSLYNKAKFGTKRLITEYIEEIVSSLNYLARQDVTSVSLEEKMDFFHRASHCNGHTALMMSGAGTLLYHHVGVVKALTEQDLMPRIISGASGGSLVAAIVGTHSKEELSKLFDPSYLQLQAQESGGGLLAYFSSIFRPQQVSPNEMRDVMERFIPDMTFQEAYDLTGIHINITVAPAEVHQTSRLLNAITSPNVMVREAVMASCAIPGLYPPVVLAAKNVHGERQPYLPSRRWIDGSVSEDLPAKRLSRLYGVNHTIVSQTNPLVLPFLNDDRNDNSLIGVVKHAGLLTVKEWSLAAAKVMQGRVSERSLAKKLVNLYTQVSSQTYTGDINILPSTRFHNPVNLIKHRSEQEIGDMILCAERETWRHIERIRIQTRISRALEDVISNFERNIIDSAEKSRELDLEQSA